MTRNGPVADFGRAVTDHQRTGDEGLTPVPCAFARHSESTAGPETGRQLPLQRSAPLVIKSLVDCFVADAHGRILGGVHLQTLRNLFGAPGRGPASVSVVE